MTQETTIFWHSFAKEGPPVDVPYDESYDILFQDIHDNLHIGSWFEDCVLTEGANIPEEYVVAWAAPIPRFKK
jgi:hypothetical protein